MGDIKSARQIAMEKIAKLGEATKEERFSWKYTPIGESLAARYLKQECDLADELKKYENNVTRYVIEGASDILIRTINLPRDDVVKKNNRRAMDGLKALKSNKVAVENVYSEMRRIFNHYVGQGDQQRRQAHERLRIEIGAKMQQAIQQQFGTSTMRKIDVEKQPQFQEEWRKILKQLDMQYIKLLDEYKQELLAIT